MVSWCECSYQQVIQTDYVLRWSQIADWHRHRHRSDPHAAGTRFHSETTLAGEKKIKSENDILFQFIQLWHFLTPNQFALRNANQPPCIPTCKCTCTSMTFPLCTINLPTHCRCERTCSSFTSTLNKRLWAWSKNKDYKGSMNHEILIHLHVHSDVNYCVESLITT